MILQPFLCIVIMVSCLIFTILFVFGIAIGNVLSISLHFYLIAILISVVICIDVDVIIGSVYSWWCHWHCHCYYFSTGHSIQSASFSSQVAEGTSSSRKDLYFDLSDYQVMELQRSFSKNWLLTSDVREKLASELDISERRIAAWFSCELHRQHKIAATKSKSMFTIYLQLMTK